MLFKSYDGKRSRMVKLVKISLRALIVDILCIEVWSKKLIFVAFISVLTISFYLIKVCFLISFHKFTVLKMKSGIILRYIVIYKKALKK